jgi:PAS domain S-box-containing protein
MRTPGGCAPQTYSFWFIDRNGKGTPATLTVRKRPTTMQLIACVTDSTVQNNLEGILRANEGVINNLPDATFAIDRNGRVIAWNRAMEEITGVPADDILGRGNYEYALPFFGEGRPMLIDLISEPDFQIEKWGYSGIRRNGNVVIAETPALDQSNLPHVLLAIAAPIFDRDGERAGAIESLADITRRRREVTALQDSLVQFREILENTGSATAIIESDDTISYINPEFERMLGYVQAEIVGKKWMEFVVPEDIARMQDYRIRQKEPLPSPPRYEFRFIRWDGSVRNGFVSITRIPDTEKIVIALFDITDKVIAEEAVRRANKKLNFFNSTTRHEILNQLTVLKGYLEVTREQTADQKLIKSLDKELAAAEAIESLILFTRDFQDIGITAPEWQDVKATVIKSIAGIRLGDICISLDIGQVEILADRLLEKVFFHLIQNSINHGEKTTTIRFSCRESFEELYVICEDNGVGVPMDAKEKIFNRQFYRETGLDMYLAKEILSITGISIIETGTPGKGARFEIHVPKGEYRFTGPV